MIDAGLLNPDLSLPTRGSMVVPGLPADMQPVTLKPAGLGNINSIKTSCALALSRIPQGDSRSTWCRNIYLKNPGHFQGDCQATCQTYLEPNSVQVCQECADKQCPKITESEWSQGPYHGFLKFEAAQGLVQRKCMQQPNACNASCGNVLRDAYKDSHDHGGVLGRVVQAADAVAGLSASDLEGAAAAPGHIADIIADDLPKPPELPDFGKYLRYALYAVVALVVLSIALKIKNVLG